jgi:hypothetical protein
MAWKPWSSWEATFEKLPKRVCILDETGCEGRPFIHTILAEACKKQNGPDVLLVAFDRPFTEYVSVGRRLGHDLNLATIQKKFSAVCLMGLDDLTMDSIVKLVTNAKSNKPTFIIVDGISVLPALGWSLFRTLELIRRLEALTDSICIRANRGMTDGIRISRWLAHRCDAVISPRKLVSGTSRLAHGEILFSNNRSTLSKCSALFKCSDSSILVQPKPQL